MILFHQTRERHRRRKPPLDVTKQFNILGAGLDVMSQMFEKMFKLGRSGKCKTYKEAILELQKFVAKKAEKARRSKVSAK